MPKRACDGCRRRKVKCDARGPQCSNCRMSSLTCEYTVPAKKRGPPFRVVKDGHRKAPNDNPQTPIPELSPPCSENNVIITPEDSANNHPLFNQEPDHQEVAQQTFKTPFREAQDDLLSALGKALPYAPLEDVLSTCIDLYMQWHFPTGPVICEPIVRASVPLVVPILRGETAAPGPGETPIPIPTLDIPTMRVFALLTAICAAVSSMLPRDTFPAGGVLAWPFLRTSREALRLYQDHDIEHPESSSVIIRYFHSNALHALGRTRVSWHAMGEALRIVQEMRLYDDASYRGLEWPEADLRRNAFWHLYIGDKSASILNRVPISLHQICLDTPITVVFDESLACGLMDSSRAADNAAFESQLRLGFRLCLRLWYTASEMLVDLKLLSRLRDSAGSLNPARQPSFEVSSLRTSITQSYLDFTSILHNCPTWIRNPSSATADIPDATTARFRRLSFSNQKANLFVTFHTLRLTLLSRFAERGSADILGLTNDQAMLSLRKVEIASDLLDSIADIPFHALQANGEPCVEKLRQIGVALLEIMHGVGNEAISTRAKSLFGTLLDILARLNSRISDELSNDCES